MHFYLEEYLRKLHEKLLDIIISEQAYVDNYTKIFHIFKLHQTKHIKSEQLLKTHSKSLTDYDIKMILNSQILPKNLTAILYFLRCLGNKVTDNMILLVMAHINKFTFPPEIINYIKYLNEVRINPSNFQTILKNFRSFYLILHTNQQTQFARPIMNAINNFMHLSEFGTLEHPKILDVAGCLAMSGQLAEKLAEQILSIHVETDNEKS